MKFQPLTDTQHLKVLTKFHEEYLKRLNFYGIKASDLNRFSWSEGKYLNIYVLYLYSEQLNSTNHQSLIFATKSDSKNQLLFLNAVEQTKNPEYLTQVNRNNIFEWLVTKNIISPNLKSKIINSSVIWTFFSIDEVNEYFPKKEACSWVDKEYSETLTIESNPTQLTPFPTSHQHYFIDRYHFNDMLNTINNDQFTDEFNQCLFAYEHEKWFLCASGLGSCLEHLLFLVLENYDPNRENLLDSFPKDPTGRHYIERFRRRPIHISRRQETYLNILFTARNAVDHHNTGYTQRNLCDVMLNGISSVFNDYFVPSLQN